MELHEIEEGDKVSVQKHIVVVSKDTGGFTGNDGQYYRLHYPKCWNVALAEKYKPKHWPPEIGDIWEAEGSEYYVTTVDDKIAVHAFDTRRGKYSYVDLPYYVKHLEDFRTLKPVLLRRRGMDL